MPGSKVATVWGLNKQQWFIPQLGTRAAWSQIKTPSPLCTVSWNNFLALSISQFLFYKMDKRRAFPSRICFIDKMSKNKHSALNNIWHIVSVQSLSHVQLFATPCTAARQASLCITNSWSLLKLMSIKSVVPPNHLILCCSPLLLLSIFPSIRVFSNESFFTSGSQSIGASASVLPMNIQDWFPLGLTGLISLQSKGFSRVFSNTTVQKHQFFGIQFLFFVFLFLFFMVQLSPPYMTPGKTTALTRWTFVGKVISLFQYAV